MQEWPQLRETLRAGEEHASDHLVEKYQFLIERLRQDIRFFFHSLQEFVDLPVDWPPNKTWETCTKEMEKDLAQLAAVACKEGATCSLDPIVALLNYRGKLLTYLLNGMLYEKSTLDRELKSQREYESGPMAEMIEHIRTLLAKSERLPEKYQLPDLPDTSTPGPFTFERVTDDSSRAGAAAEVTSVQRTLVAVFREMQSLDRGLRRMKFGPQAHVPDKHRPGGKLIRSDEMRKEITKWFDRCSRLEHELQTSKAQRHTPWEQQLEQLSVKCAEKDVLNKQHITRVHKLEGDVAALKAELSNVRREQQDLTEKNQKMARENLPVLDKIDKALNKAREDADRLTADAEMLSSMFKLQVEDYKQATAERDEVAKELSKAQRLLKGEKMKNQFKADELQKKETLHQRTVEARNSTLETYLRQKKEIEQVQRRLEKREAERKKIQGVLEDRDTEIRKLATALRRAHRAIDELEQHKRFLAQEFKAATGRSYSMLLEQCKAAQAKAHGPPSASPRR